MNSRKTSVRQRFDALALFACAASLALAFGLSQAAIAQDEGPDLFALVRAAQIDGDLAVVAALEAARDAVPDSDLDLWRDLLGTRLSFVHDAVGALRLDSKAYLANKGGPRSDPSLEGYEPQDAVGAILGLAQSRQVLMLNEEHRRSQQRAFAHELLEPLVDAGFTHLALETLDTNTTVNAALAERGYPLVSDGYYTRDPVLGDLVRRALELGLVVVGYEADMARVPSDLADDPLSRTNWREGQQARNLMAILEREPESRLVVWCGRHHLSEIRGNPGENDWTPMGGIFAEASGIDPLTLDLMVMNEADVPAREPLVYREAADAGVIERPTIFVDAKGVPYSALSHLDVMVFLPRSRYEGGRPQWMRMGGLRRAYELDLEGEGLAPGPGRPLLLEARLTGEAPTAVPLDQVLWRTGAPPVLLLRPGPAYALRILAPPAEVVWEGEY